MERKKLTWEHQKNDFNYVRIDELSNGKISIATRETMFGRSFVVQLIKFKNGSADLNDDVDLLNECSIESNALKYATKKRKEYLKLLRHMEGDE